MEYYSAIKRNAFESVSVRLMNLQPIIQSEVRKINIIYYLIYMESRKTVLMSLFEGEQWRCRCREQTYGHREGRIG